MKKMSDGSFRQRVEACVARIPEGCVTTYGDLAGMAGQAHAARVVGGIAHYGNPELPWHRVVNRLGGLASGYHGGRRAQSERLEAEGVSCTHDVVNDFEERRWRP